MLSDMDNFYQQKEEPLRGCLLALREIILSLDKDITTAWKYKMPFFCYHGKMFCYLWIHKKYGQPYIGIVEGKKLSHPSLIIENRSRMKIMLLNPEKDLPLRTINKILKTSLSYYR